MNENIRQLEEKIAYLERHVVEQDKAMLEFADELAALRREIRALRDAASGSGATRRDDNEASDERPPHY